VEEGVEEGPRAGEMERGAEEGGVMISTFLGEIMVEASFPFDVNADFDVDRGAVGGGVDVSVFLGDVGGGFFFSFSSSFFVS